MSNKEIDQLIEIINNYKNLSESQTYKIVHNKFKKINFKLYKYYSLSNEYTLSNIQNDILYLNNPSAFNDPFDCYLGYTYKHVIQDICLNLILEDVFQMDYFAMEAFTKFILCEELSPDEKMFFNSKIKLYGRELSEIDIDKWNAMDVEQRLPLLCNLLVDDGNALSAKIIDASHTMANLQTNIRKSIDEHFLITCFSETYDNQLMWAHYADSHRGICVEYDLSKIDDIEINYIKLNLLPVKYCKARPQIPIQTDRINQYHYKVSEGNYTISDQYRFLLTKSMDWKYEREWRIILQDAQSRIIKFPLISNIYLGANITTDNKKKIENIAKKKGITCYQLVPSLNDYKLLIL